MIMNWLKIARFFPLLGLLVICGCESESVPSHGKKIVRFWQFMAAVENLEPIIEKFEKLNPDIDVQIQQLTYDNGFEKIVTSIAVGSAPDLCEIGSTWLARFAAEGAIEDLSAGVEELQDSLLMMEMVRYNGKYFGIPWILGTRALFFNKDLLAKAGLDSSRAPPYLGRTP